MDSVAFSPAIREPASSVRLETADGPMPQTATRPTTGRRRKRSKCCGRDTVPAPYPVRGRSHATRPRPDRGPRAVGAPGDLRGSRAGPRPEERDTSMRMQAAVLEEFGAPLVVQEVELADPGPGEVLVRLVACGVCHTDLSTASGADPSGYAPAVLGHEGAGVVEAVGAGGGSHAAGGRVVPLI